MGGQGLGGGGVMKKEDEPNRANICDAHIQRYGIIWSLCNERIGIPRYGEVISSKDIPMSFRNGLRKRGLTTKIASTQCLPPSYKALQMGGLLLQQWVIKS